MKRQISNASLKYITNNLLLVASLLVLLTSTSFFAIRFSHLSIFLDSYQHNVDA